MTITMETDIGGDHTLPPSVTPARPSADEVWAKVDADSWGGSAPESRDELFNGDGGEDESLPEEEGIEVADEDVVAEEDLPTDEDESAQETGEDEEEPEVNVASTRAAERIKQVVAERNAERQARAALEAEVRNLVAIQRQQAEMQNRFIAERQAQVEAAQKQQQEAALWDRLRQGGLNEADASHQLVALNYQKIGDIERVVQEFKTAAETQKREAAVQAYTNALRSELVTLTDGYDVPAEAQELLYSAAYNAARDQQIADPREAVAKAVKPLLSAFRAKAKGPVKVATKRPQPGTPEHTAHKVISTRTRAAGKPSGTKVGKQPMSAELKAFLK